MVAAASKGIGLAIAKELAAEGCQLSICARNEESLEQAVEQIHPDTRTYVVDVSSREDLEWWVSETRRDLGAPDILITNTGGPPAGPVHDLTDEQWQAGIDSTLMNVVRLYRLVRPEMIEKGWGRIVHITSLVAKEPNELLPISSTLRTGLMALTRLQATDLAAHGVTVNSVLPGNTLTDRQRHLLEIRAEKEGLSQEEALAKQAASIPMKRLAEPEEIAAAVAFLCSTRASYITGVNLLVDGGVTKTFA
ncbi:MAG: 3-oxoacyl-[acyl-carrier protein] reductase [Fimbriimonadaceae bacterium]|nr:3-oxoacyl-[acyl-carrier protein] reductase [Fimbriimonadaceae bacterium]